MKINVHTFSRKKPGNNETSLTQWILRLKGTKLTKLSVKNDVSLKKRKKNGVCINFSMVN